MTPPITKALALDCEMVTGYNGSLLAQVAICNENGDCILNSYVKQQNVKDYMTNLTGITPNHLQSGRNYEVVRSEANIIRGRILVGHALQHDLDALKLTHPGNMKRDTAIYFRTEQGPPSLKDLTREHLGISIQDGPHNALKDARAVMRIYKKFEDKKGW